MGMYKAKLRYRMKEEPCMIERAPDNRCFLLFYEYQFAPAPGQTVAIYDDDIVIGGGVIDYTY